MRPIMGKTKVTVDIEQANSGRQCRTDFLEFSSILVGMLVPVLIPVGQMLIFYSLWHGLKHPVDTTRCSCSCWDTIFKGPYESGISAYKHFYFNSTWNMLKIWTIIVLGIICLYECFKRLLRLFGRRKLRLTMGLLFLVSIFSNYYAWWGTINYYNDEFYNQWYHQLFFTISELVTTILAFQNLDRNNPINPTALLIIGNIALVHICFGSWDQFVANVIMGDGRLHQVLRDLLFMSTDLIYLLTSFLELRKYHVLSGESLQLIITQKSNLRVLATVNGILLVSSLFLLG